VDFGSLRLLKKQKAASIEVNYR